MSLCVGRAAECVIRLEFTGHTGVGLATGGSL